MKASELMTPSPCCASADDSIQDVARLMRDNDVGSVPIVDESSRVIGIVTDRDLAVRALAEGKATELTVRDVMTASPCTCGADDDVKDVGRTMSDNQVRRVPVVDANGRVVGIIAQADLALAADRKISEKEVARVVEKISEPATRQPNRSENTGLEQQF
jgi:CBS domain-containing protein